MDRAPPGKDFSCTVLALSRPLASATFRLSVGQSRTMGAIRRRENFFASSMLGWMYNMEPGSWSMAYPMQFKMNSDLPTWEDATMVSRRTRGSEKASIGSTRYGVLALRQGPASALLSRDRTLYCSAHWLTVRSAGGV